MGFWNLGVVGSWIASNGYAFLFVLMLFEGPVVTAAAAFAAALGLLNIYWVFILSIFGNIIPDAAYYAIGYWGRERFIDQYGHYLHLTQERVKKFERFIELHSGKSIIAIKLIPFVATPGLIAAGLMKMNLKKYMFWNVITTIPSSLAYLLIGYYFGAAYTLIIRDINIGGYIITGIIILFLCTLPYQKNLTARLTAKIENE